MLETGDSYSDHRQQQAVDRRLLIRSSNSTIAEAIDDAIKTAPEGLAHEALSADGLYSSKDFIYARDLFAALPADSPLKLAGPLLQVVFTTQGHAFTSSLIELGEEHLRQGLPMSKLSREWAEAMVKGIRATARSVRQEGKSPTEPPSVLLARNERRITQLLARIEELEGAVEARDQALLVMIKTQEQSNQEVTA